MRLQARVYRFCKWKCLGEAMQLGWVVIDDFSTTHHGVYSCLVGWICDCPPPWIE
jgi:hypothetical protein